MCQWVINLALCSQLPCGASETRKQKVQVAEEWPSERYVPYMTPQGGTRRKFEDVDM